MKKLLFPIAILAAMAVVFTSCNNDENDDPRSPESATVQITAVVPGGAELSSLISQVRVYAEGDEASVTVASASFANNGTFSMLLSETPTNALETIWSSLVEDGFTVTDTTTKWTWAFVQALSSSENLVGAFWNERVIDTQEEFSVATEVYVYVDRDVSITGTFEFEEGGVDVEETWEVHFRKGWNRMFMTFGEDEDGEFDIFTTTPVTGLTWVFEPLEDLNNVAPARAAVQEGISRSARLNAFRERR